ncbi:MAG: GHKL domain-containing protein [Lachnospiraceae bacterium]|nr:GHKL domain-containing protein [Lachnospiraceae bacterium]
MMYGYLVIILVTFSLLAYRLLGEDNQRVYLPLFCQILTSSITAMVIHFASIGFQPLEITLILVLGSTGGIVVSFFINLLTVDYVVSVLQGYMGLFSLFPIREFVISHRYPILVGFLAALLILISMDFGGVRFSKESRWFLEGWEKNKIGNNSILCVGVVVEIFLLSSHGNLFISILIVGSMIANILNLRFFNKLKTVSRREAAVSQWMEDSKDYMNVIRSQRHDYNLHIHTLVGLIENEDYEAALAYMRNMASEASDVNDIMPLDDAVLGSLLYNMREAARKKNTEIYYNITYDMKDTLCSGFDCNKIIGNLLQNAIDAAVTKKAKEYGIHVRILKRRGNTVIYIENYFDGNKEDILKAFEVGYTTKYNHEGIGLAMVLRAVNRAQGRIYPEFDTDIIRFVVNLPNKVNFDEE